ncbi:MAG: aspartate carbamoyltransferase [Patescibacteria group bacterium]|nr:aspartate carbamoyltransferase [Patescibacteria group bacterium]
MELAHILESQQFAADLDGLDDFYRLAIDMEHIFESGGDPSILKGAHAVNLFSQPSTRTHASFRWAQYYLGVNIAFDSENAKDFSSESKGEVPRHTVRVHSQYCHDPRKIVIVLRHGNFKAMQEFAQYSPGAHIINAGCGKSDGQHVTQTLGDVLTIRRERPGLKRPVIAMVGDLRNGRTVRSLSYLAPRVFPETKIIFASPITLAMMPDIKEYLSRHGFVYEETFEPKDFPEVLRQADVVYMTRIQREDLAGSDLDRFEEYQLAFQLNAGNLDGIKETGLIMHPLPSNKELAPEVDDDPRAVYLTSQLHNNLLVRMAGLHTLLKPHC